MLKNCPRGGNYPYEGFEETALRALRGILVDDNSRVDDPANKTGEMIAILRDDLAKADLARSRLYDLYSMGDDDPMLLGKLSDARSKVAALKDEIERLERTLAVYTAQPSQLASDVGPALIKRALENDEAARAEVAREAALDCLARGVWR